MQFNTEQEYLEYLLKEPDTSTFQSCMEYIEAIENWSSFLLGGYGVDVIVNGTACMLPIFFGNDENNISITSKSKLEALQTTIHIFRAELLEYKEKEFKPKLKRYKVGRLVDYNVRVRCFKSFEAIDIDDLKQQIKNSREDFKITSDDWIKLCDACDDEPSFADYTPTDEYWIQDDNKRVEHININE